MEENIKKLEDMIRYLPINPKVKTNFTYTYLGKTITEIHHYGNSKVHIMQPQSDIFAKSVCGRVDLWFINETVVDLPSGQLCKRCAKFNGREN